jgi:hypothetical protein
MQVMSAQGYLIEYYTELASRRGNHAGGFRAKSKSRCAALSPF